MTEPTAIHGENYSKRVDVLISRLHESIDLTIKEGSMPYATIIGCLELVKIHMIEELKDSL